MTTNYGSDGFDRRTQPSSSDDGTVIKYILPRVIGQNLSKYLQCSLFGFPWAGLSQNISVPAPTNTHGLAVLGQNSIFTTISSIHSINGERFIDELRELSRLNEILGHVILQCCTLETHSRAQQIQLDWFRNYQSQNASIIKVTYLTEIDAAEKILQGKLAPKAALQKQYQEILPKTAANKEQFQQLLARRNALGQELLDLERQIAESNVEAQFLQRRIRHTDEDSKFYTSQNQALQNRQARLRYELDEDKFVQEALKSELEILANEKITAEDVHASSLDEAQKAIDVSHLPSLQPMKAFHDHLFQEVVRVRTEFEKKIEAYREELHRKFELDLHRYQIQRTYPVPTVTKEHEAKLEQYTKEKQDIVQQIAAVRGRMDEIKLQIQSMENQVQMETSNKQSTTNIKKSLTVMHGIISDRERQLQEAMHNRASLKSQIDIYRQKLNRYPQQLTATYLNQRVSVHEVSESTRLVSAKTLPFTVQPSSKEASYGNSQSGKSVPIGYSSGGAGSTNAFVAWAKRPALDGTKDWRETGTLWEDLNFNLKQDTDELFRLLANANIDEFGIIRILCNRSVNQRVQIREQYRTSYNQNLGDNLEMITNHSLNKLLRILLMSLAEYDCYELQRILKGSKGDEAILLEIFLTRTSKHLKTVKETYQRLFQKTLEQDIISYQPNPSQRIFLTLLQAKEFDGSSLDQQTIQRDAEEIVDIVAQWRSEEVRFLRLLCSRSNVQLKQMFAAYQQISGTDIEQDIQERVDRALYEIYTTIFRIVRNRPRYFAYELHKSLQHGTPNEENLNRIIVSRCEIDMVQIKIEYEIFTNRTLYTHVQTDVHGNYKLALLELLRQRVDLGPREPRFGQQSGTTGPGNVQWRKPLSVSSTGTFPARPLTRVQSDHAIDETRRFALTKDETRSSMREFTEYSSRVERNRIQHMNTSLIKTKYSERRSFRPMPSTPENYVGLNHTQD